jgi:hypothetical protein
MSAVPQPDRRPSATFRRLQARLRGLVGKAIEDYGNRIFRNPGFLRSLTEKEKNLRELPL